MKHARALAVGVAAVALAGCGSTTTTTVTTAVTAPPQTVTTTVTAPPRTVTARPPTTPDRSSFVEQVLSDKTSGGTGQSTHAFLQNGYPGAAIQLNGTQCVEEGATQHYQCVVSYTVSGSSDPSQDGSYTLSATGSCDNSGSCQTVEDAVDTASRQ
jgi:hypothetical protein